MLRFKPVLVLTFVVLSISILVEGTSVAHSSGNTLYVDDDDMTCGGSLPCYSTINDAVADANQNDIIEVFAGNYIENITLDGTVTLRSSEGPHSTILDGGGVDSVVEVVGGADVVIQGFTIRNGGATCTCLSEEGYGVYVSASLPTVALIKGNIFVDNAVKGAIAINSVDVDSSVVAAVVGNVVLNNGSDDTLAYAPIEIRVPSHESFTGSVAIANNIVAKNIGYVSGGIAIEYSTGVVFEAINNTVYGNHGEVTGGLFVSNSNTLIANNILYANTGGTTDDIMLSQVGLSAEVTHNIIGDGQFDGTSGNFDSNPLLDAPAANDFHLRDSSPAIDTANDQYAPPVDFEGDPRFVDGNGDGIGRSDVGADETHALDEPVTPTPPPTAPPAVGGSAGLLIDDETSPSATPATSARSVSGALLAGAIAAAAVSVVLGRWRLRRR